MRKRPRAVTVVGVVFVAFGCIALPYSVLRLMSSVGTTELYDVLAGQPANLLLAATARVAALVGGLFVLRGSSWARWLLVAWAVYHVGISALHEPVQIVAHGVLLATVAYLLFRRDSAVYFGPRHLDHRI
jgi:hypothetical protein